MNVDGGVRTYVTFDAVLADAFDGHPALHNDVVLAVFLRDFW